MLLSCIQEPSGSGSRFSGKQKLDAYASFKLSYAAGTRLTCSARLPPLVLGIRHQYVASSATYILSIASRANNPRGRVCSPCSPAGTPIPISSDRDGWPARRLFEAGARRVEVTLTGWDTHVAAHSGHREQAAILESVIAAVIADSQ